MHKIYKYQSGGLSGNLFPLYSTKPKPLKLDLTAENNKLQSYLQKAGSATSSGLSALQKNSGLLSSVTGIASNLVTSLTPQATDTGSQIGGQVLSAAGDLASMIPGFGPLAGIGLKGLSTLVTSVGPNVKGNTNKELTDGSSSYSGLDKLDSKKFGLFGIGAGKRYKDKVAEREKNRGVSESILRTSQTNADAAIGATQNYSNQRNLAMTGGWQQNNGIRFGKTGVKIEYDLTFARQVLTPSKNDTLQFKDGGKMNVIPDGALHSRKHDIDETSLDGKITKKGIPVICKEGGGIEQVAEIEKNEIIFTKEVTEKLERFRDLGTPEAAIDAGKLLVKEILYNTIDNTGLLNTIE